jgi:hypothetical protein
VPFSSLARFTRQHAYRLVVPPVLAFSVSFGSAVVPGIASIPGVDQATMAVSMTPWAVGMSTSTSAKVQPVEAPKVAEQQVPIVASQEPAAPPSEPIESVVIAPDPAPEAVASPEPTGPEMPTASGTPMRHAAQPADPSSTLAWGAAVSPAFVAKVHRICADLGCESNDLMAAIAFESVETFSPSIRNPMSGATGLIQFMSDTAQGLGTSTDELATMSPEDQLTYVEKYFRPYAGHLSTI